MNRLKFKTTYFQETVLFIYYSNAQKTCKLSFFLRCKRGKRGVCFKISIFLKSLFSSNLYVNFDSNDILAVSSGDNAIKLCPHK